MNPGWLISCLDTAGKYVFVYTTAGQSRGKLLQRWQLRVLNQSNYSYYNRIFQRRWSRATNRTSVSRLRFNFSIAVKDYARTGNKDNALGSRAQWTQGTLQRNAPYLLDFRRVSAKSR